MAMKLIPINDKPVIEHIMDKFKEYGQNKFFITVNYKSSLLSSYFKSLKKESKEIKVINERIILEYFKRLLIFVLRTK